MTRRNLTTTFMVVSAGLLLFGGVALAREVQTGDDHRPQVAATPSQATDDVASPTASPVLGDDNGGSGADDTASPTASPDDHGGNRNGSDDSTRPTATPDDHGGNRNGSDDSASPTARPTPRPTASPDDHGGDDSASPTASPDDNGGHGGDDS